MGDKGFFFPRWTQPAFFKGGGRKRQEKLQSLPRLFYPGKKIHLSRGSETVSEQVMTAVLERGRLLPLKSPPKMAFTKTVAFVSNHECCWFYKLFQDSPLGLQKNFDFSVLFALSPSWVLSPPRAGGAEKRRKYPGGNLSFLAARLFHIFREIEDLPECPFSPSEEKASFPQKKGLASSWTQQVSFFEN